MLEFVGSTLVPSEVLDSDICVNEAYPNLRIAYVPAENRSENEPYPFAIVDTLGEFTIKPLTVEQAKNTMWILQWLYDNDSARHGEKELWNKHLAVGERIKEDRKKAHSEKLREKLDVVSSVARSHLHTYKVNGKKIGADNERPRLGLWDEN
jgi:hypothetical protein